MKKLLLTSAAVLILATPAYAQTDKKALWAGGSKGAYYNTFCPPLVPALKNAQFTGYHCVVEQGGSPANIQHVLENPTSIGFVQTDVYARTVAAKPELNEKLTVIRNLPACEGIWMVTKNPAIKDFGDVLGLARRLPFVVAAGGSTETFEFIKSIDPDGLGRVRNVESAADATAMLNRIIAEEAGPVGMFVQWFDPENPNIKLMLENKLTIIPVVSRELVRAKVADKSVYQVQKVSAGGKDLVSACTPVSVITGAVSQFTDRNDIDDQKDLLKVVNDIPEASLLPAEGRMASLFKLASKLSSNAVESMMAAAEATKKKLEKMNP